MTKRVRWTSEEDKILVQAIKANPHNKAEAFRIADKKLGRGFTNCENRWYKHLSNPYSKHYVGCLFTLVGTKSKLDNRTSSTNKSRVTPVEIKKGIWSKIKALLGIK